MKQQSSDWILDCMHWRGKVLTGKRAHWCEDWDGLPVDETTPEWPCNCRWSESKKLQMDADCGCGSGRPMERCCGYD
jgi:hypothetical protein